MSGGWDDDKWIICIGFPDGGDRQTSPYADYVGVVRRHIHFHLQQDYLRNLKTKFLKFFAKHMNLLEYKPNKHLL